MNRWGMLIFAVMSLMIVCGPSARADFFKKNAKAVKAPESAERMKPAVKAAEEAADPRTVQIPEKLKAIQSQQESLKILEARLEVEKKQLEDMQNDFAVNFKVDPAKLKAGKVRWDDDKKQIVTG